MPYVVRQEVDEIGTVVSVQGDADASAASELLRVITGLDASTVVVDLSEATLIDSRTIAVLVDRTEHLRAAAGDLIVVCADRNILRLFRRIGLDSELTIVDSRAAAKEAVRHSERHRALKRRPPGVDQFPWPQAALPWSDGGDLDECPMSRPPRSPWRRVAADPRRGRGLAARLPLLVALATPLVIATVGYLLAGWAARGTPRQMAHRSGSTSRSLCSAPCLRSFGGPATAGRPVSEA